MKTLTLLCLLVVAAFQAQAQHKDDGQELIDTFFDIYQRKGYESALKYAWSTNKWIEIQGGEMDNIIAKLQKEVTNMGEYIGYEEIRSKRVGSRFRIASYLVYYLRDPIRFTFEMYKTTGGWEISSFDFDTRFDEELEEAIKLHIDY